MWVGPLTTDDMMRDDFGAQERDRKARELSTEQLWEARRSRAERAAMERTVAAKRQLREAKAERVRVAMLDTLAVTTLLPASPNGYGVADWCSGCARITRAHFMEWTGAGLYRCWTCTRGIAVPVVEPADLGP